VSVELYRHLDPAGLRLLIELSSLRTLADRGLSDQELAVSRQLARATMRSARAADVSGYLESDVAFHEYLLGLAGGRDRCGVARRLLARDAEEDGPAGSDLRESMIAGASEHGKIPTSSLTTRRPRPPTCCGTMSREIVPGDTARPARMRPVPISMPSSAISVTRLWRRLRASAVRSASYGVRRSGCHVLAPGRRVRPGVC
jgi:hypothetical protein